MDESPQRRRVVLADWDNTFYEGFTLTSWVEHLESKRLFGSLRAMYDLFDRFRKGLLDYKELCCRTANAYAEGLSGRSRSEIIGAGASFIEFDEQRIFRFVRNLRDYFKSQDLTVLVLSGAPEEPLTQYAKAIGFELTGALRLEVQRGFYTGRILQNCGLLDVKRELVRETVARSDVVVAFGDHESDRPLLDEARFSFVMHGAPHKSPPLGPRLLPLHPWTDPDEVVRLVRRQLDCDESDPACLEINR